MILNKNKLLVYVIGILIAYTYGIFTAQYKVFPYHETRSIKRFFINDSNAKKINYTSRNLNYYLYKKSFFEEHVRKVAIVMLGDSITDHGEWQDLFPSKTITNQGISGDTTAGVLDRVDLIHKTEASKVFVMIGINDLSRGMSIVDVFENYQKIVNKLVKNNIKVYIQSTLLKGKKRSNINKKVIALNNMLENIADTNELITYIDLNEALSNGSYLREGYSYDDLHLNAKGFKVWKDIIRPYIM